MIVRGLAGRREIRAELAQQKILFPDGGLPDRLVRYAGRQVDSGPTARAFAEMIGHHLAAATGGRTYAAIVDEWQAGGRGDERLTKLRETAFVGQTLRGSLLGAYQAWEITALVIGLGTLCCGLGVAFAAMAAAWH
jgi:hypothetical protein